MVTRFFGKTKGFSALELLLVVVIAVVIGGSIYVIKYTDIVSNLFRNNTTTQSATPQLVDTPQITHNQMIMSLSGAALETKQVDRHFLFAFGKRLKVATEWPINAGFLVRSEDGIHFDLLGYRYLKTNMQFAQDGYDALQNLDTNSDGTLDGLDVDYDELYFWQDLNNNGIVDSNEVKKIADLGIIAIHLDSMQKVNEKVNRSIVTRRLAFSREDGSKGVLFDTDLFQNPYYREYVLKLPVDDDVKKLPDVVASGSVRDLREAITLNSELLSLFVDYLVADAADRRFIRMDRLLFEWAKTSDYPSVQTRLQDAVTPRFDLAADDTLALIQYDEGIDKQQDVLRKIIILEDFTGQRLLYFFTQEVLNSSTRQWELHFMASLGRQVIASQIIPANTDGTKRKIILTADMFHFTPEQIIDITSQYNQLKRTMFDRIQAKANVEVSNQFGSSKVQWMDLKLQTQIETGESYRQQHNQQLLDLPRRRHLIECIKPNNIVDDQVIDCAAGKISKTW